MSEDVPDASGDPADPRTWSAYFRLHLTDLRPDLAPAEAGRLARCAWHSACLLQPSHAARLVANAIDRRSGERRFRPRCQ